MLESSKMKDVDAFWNPNQSSFFIIITMIIGLLWYSHKKHSYWKNKGIPFAKPFPLLGIIVDEFITPSQTDELKRYFKYGPIHGFYEGLAPVICVGDVKLLRDILIKDFKVFPNRRDLKSGKELADNAVAILEGDDWKRVRNVVTRASSTNKIKKMLEPFNKSSLTMIEYFKTYSQGGKPINFTKQLTAPIEYALLYAVCSTKIEDVYNPGNEFVRRSEMLLGTRNWRLVLAFFPSIRKLFRCPVTNPQSLKFFANTVLQIIEERKRTGQIHDDILQMFIDSVQELTGKGKCEDANKNTDFGNILDKKGTNEITAESNTKKRFSLLELQSNVDPFLSSANQIQLILAFSSYFLAINGDIQKKAFEEIVECLRKTKGILTYEALQEMKYVDNIISETLRICPLFVRLDRKAEDNYKLADTGITIPKGMLVSIPVYAIHHDPKHYPDPEKFDPNRFTTGEKSKRDTYAYLPFGVGPRSCAGMRSVLHITKVFLIHLICSFIIKTCPQTQIPLEFKISIFMLHPKDIFLKLEERRNSPLVN